MIILTTGEVITIHEKLVEATGGSPGIRDIGLLESAVLGCTQTGVADGSIDYEDIVDWVNSHITN